MQEIIDSAVLELIRIIESKQDSRKVAWQFVLEELDAAKNGSDFVQDRIKSFYINSNDYIGAMSRRSRTASISSISKANPSLNRNPKL